MVVTLAILVLLLGLTVGLFVTANSELRSASLYKNSQGLRELADTSVNLVEAQIKDATTTNAAGAPDRRSTWASQPGMIRTYGSGTNAATSYKLFSWSNPRVAGDDNTAVPADWPSNPALYTDLNEPVPDSQNPADTNAYRYPIAYPPSAGTNAPLGYSVTNAPTATGGAFTNSVPMPVQWLYVLRDGGISSGSATGTNQVTVPGATTDNPIVARIAFWTDDETSKVNLNTAAGGEFWGRPVQKTRNQLTNSYWLPARWEFQRYPGHPARTDVQAVFPDLTRKQIWSLIPRVSDNGATAATAMTTKPSSVPSDMDRLFASVGETRFSATNFTADNSRTDFTNNWSDRIERSKFLVTASSRAPETTVYGTPRVSLWPIPANTNYRTTLDSLFAFCSTIQNTTTTNNPRPYYFVHSNSANVTGDVTNSTNTTMFTYLNSLSGCSNIPGIGTVGLTTKYTPAGRDQLVTQFYDYVRNVNKHDDQLRYPDGVTLAPGFSWGWMFSPQGQVVPAVKRVTATGTNYGFGRLPTVNQVALHFITTADADNPASANATNRSLWTNTSSNSYVPLGTNQICVMAVAYVEPAMVGAGFPYANTGDHNLLNDGVGMPFNVSGLDQLTLEGQPLGFPPLAQLHVAGWVGAANVVTGRSGGIIKYLSFFVQEDFCKAPESRGGFTNADTITINYNARGSGPITTISNRGKITGTVNGTPNVPRTLTLPSMWTNALGTTVNLSGSYPLVSDPVRITKGSTMSLGSANLRVEIVLQKNTNSVAIPVPCGSIPAPSLPPTTNSWAFSPEGWDGASSGRFPYLNTTGWETNLFLPDYDSVYAVATAHGDYRISMVRPNSPKNWAPVPQNPSAPNFRHRLFSGAPKPNQWVPGANYPDRVFELLSATNGNVRPGVPYKAHLDALGFSGPLTYGDFDNGIPSSPDGAYISSPDEATAYPSGSYNGWTESYDGSALDKTAIFTTPNRKIASPVAFGSLPSAAMQDRPWQNLLFRPAPGVNHPGKAGYLIDGTPSPGAPPDSAWLDFFWMPIVEPFAISETFSTAGKINMNYQIAPFSYIRRTTAVQAVLKTGGVTAVSSVASGYTTGTYDKATWDGSAARPPVVKDNSPFPVNVDETLKGFDARLTNNAALFRTTGELCELPVVPNAAGATFNSLQDGSWWNNFQLTGDNTKEATYNDLYPRLTTRSNTYTVHYRVQVLKKLPGGDQGIWNESRDNVASELRGSTLIERYLDPNAIYPDYATAFSSSPSLETFYRFRVLQRSDFTP